MSYCLTYARMDEILSSLAGQYRIFAPKSNARKKLVRYGEIHTAAEVVYRKQSDFSPKEVLYPVSQTMFFFRDGQVEEAKEADEREILLFLRACDIHAIERLDKIFLTNGGMSDSYYKKIRKKVHFVLMECTESFEHCFCTSLGTNAAENYEMAVRFEEDRIYVQTGSGAFSSVFAAEQIADFAPTPVERNRKELRLPEISENNLREISEMELWEEFNDKCIACGGCNMVCGCCSCFDTVDIRYSESSNDGERRRVWSGCMLEDFTRTAGGALARKTKGENMRFKLLHKFYDYQKRFQDGAMCVGCGRCDMRCPQGISFFDTVCEVHDALKGGNGND